mmetsp:Transcript_25701/g.40817  ORF Transcript_25701/g.40817 Transcript_25701/m.40817 type:complete len:457 (+) Transcript_25701:56-1426(+)
MGNKQNKPAQPYQYPEYGPKYSPYYNNHPAAHDMVIAPDQRRAHEMDAADGKLDGAYYGKPVGVAGQRAPAQSPRRPNHYDRYDREGDRQCETNWNDEAEHYHSEYYRRQYGRTAARQPLDDYDYSALWMPSYMRGPDNGPYGGYPNAEPYGAYGDGPYGDGPYAHLYGTGYSRPTRSFYEYPRSYTQGQRGFSEYPGEYAVGLRAGAESKSSTPYLSDYMPPTGGYTPRSDSYQASGLLNAAPTYTSAAYSTPTHTQAAPYTAGAASTYNIPTYTTGAGYIPSAYNAGAAYNAPTYTRAQLQPGVPAHMSSNYGGPASYSAPTYLSPNYPGATSYNVSALAGIAASPSPTGDAAYSYPQSFATNTNNMVLSAPSGSNLVPGNVSAGLYNFPNGSAGYGASSYTAAAALTTAQPPATADTSGLGQGVLPSVANAPTSMNASGFNGDINAGTTGLDP